jgi:hypothetical protein
MSNELSKFTRGELVKLVTSDWVGRVTVGIIEAVDYSFNTDEVLRSVRTRNEIKRRFNICIKWFVTLRREESWSIPKILDELPFILRTELDGKYTPPINIDKIASNAIKKKEGVSHSRWVSKNAEKIVLDTPGEDIAEDPPELVNYVTGIESEGIIEE